jgi:hypothetical protein
LTRRACSREKFAVRSAVPLLLFACACAGPGKSYPCDPSLGTCGTVELPDGGRSTTPFISQPFTVWHDGAHDAAADAVAFNGSVFAAFRHASVWSADATAHVFVVRSDDQGRTWKKVGELAVTARDPRQPKLFVFGKKLYLLATVWDATDVTAHRTSLSIASSADGSTWSPFASLPSTDGLMAWRPRADGASLFVSVWGADELFPVDQPTGFSVLSSTDAAIFSSVQAPAAGPGAREGDLVVRASGERYLAVPERSVGSRAANQTFCHHTGAAAWQCWSVDGLSVEGPAMFEWGGVLFLVGKRDTGNGDMRTSIWQVLDDVHDVSPVADVTSGFGDTGGPAAVPLDDQRVLLVFHSTSILDPRVAALPSLPNEVQADANGYATDILAVELFMPSAAAGH